VVHRALLVRKGPRLDASDITFEEAFHRAPEDTEGPPLELPEGVTLEQMMQRLERQLIESTLRRCGNHKDRAAKELGLARSSLFKRLKQWGLSNHSIGPVDLLGRRRRESNPPLGASGESAPTWSSAVPVGLPGTALPGRAWRNSVGTHR